MISDTLLIRHLPVSLTAEEIQDFLKHIGAIQACVYESKIKKYSYAFAKFKNERVAGEVVSRMHQKELLGSRLVVEFANNHHLPSHASINKKEKKDDEENRKNKTREMFLRNLSNWSAGLNFALPPPHHLKYHYHGPDPATLANITNMLCCNVKFYTQVLHLMNRMNLPSPFEPTFSFGQSDIFNSFVTYVVRSAKNENNGEEIGDDFQNPEDAIEEKKEDDDDEEESELESDREENTAARLSNAAPFKRKSTPLNKWVKKRRLPIGSSTVAVSSKISKTCVEDVFDQVQLGNPAKKIEVKINTAADVAIRRRHSIENLVDDKQQELTSVNQQQSSQVKDTVSPDGCISAEELASNKISERDWQILPFFKNYRAGTPCCRLYIKNLSKQVTVFDLNYIYRRYTVSDSNGQQTPFDIRLMQEGRMKGQAFVSLENVELAELALKETNGYIIKGKPMVVQFAKTSGTSNTKSSE